MDGKTDILTRDEIIDRLKLGQHVDPSGALYWLSYAASRPTRATPAASPVPATPTPAAGTPSRPFNRINCNSKTISSGP